MLRAGRLGARIPGEELCKVYRVARIMPRAPGNNEAGVTADVISHFYRKNQALKRRASASKTGTSMRKGWPPVTLGPGIVVLPAAGTMGPFGSVACQSSAHPREPGRHVGMGQSWGHPFRMLVPVLDALALLFSA